MYIELIPEAGKFYKANLHCHSNISDGALSPEELKKIYMEKGYSIIDLFVVLKDGTWSFITGIVSTAYDGFNGFVESVSSAGNFFEFYDDESEESIFFIPLEEGETIWD